MILMDFLQKLALIWQKISLVQRVLLAAVVLAAVLIGSLLVHWARSRTCGCSTRICPRQRRPRSRRRSREKEIAYELRDGGSTIYVPREYVYQLRLDLAKEGLPVAEQNGYKLFDDEKIGISPFVQNVNLKRALQDELAKSIQMIDGVAHARVHIVSPEQKLFASDEEQTTASVVLRLRPGYRLSGTNIAAITHLVSGSVKGLKAENVTIIDSDGRLLSGKGDSTMASGAGTAQDYKERVEQGLVRKAEDMLTTVLGPGRATVQVSAVIDMNSVNTITETYDPQSKVVTKEEITNNSEIGAAAGQKTTGGSTKKDETISTEYQVGKTVKQHTVLPGEIKSLSVAAFVDLTADANQPAAGGQPALIMSVADVEQVIRTALGLKEIGFPQGRQRPVPPLDRDPGRRGGVLPGRGTWPWPASSRWASWRSAPWSFCGSSAGPGARPPRRPRPSCRQARDPRACCRRGSDGRAAARPAVRSPMP